MDDNPQNETSSPQVDPGPPRTRSRGRSALSTGAVALLVGIVCSCLAWPLLVRLGVEPVVAVPLLAGWPLVVWALVTAFRALARARRRAGGDPTGARPSETATRSVLDAARVRGERGERGWIVEVDAGSGTKSATTIRAVLTRDESGGCTGAHELRRPRTAPRSGSLDAGLATRLAAWLDASIDWDEITAAAGEPVDTHGTTGLPVSIELARFDARGEPLHARLATRVEPAPRDARDWLVHRLLAQVLDLGARAPWLRIDLRGNEARWSAARPSDTSFRPDIAGISFWAGPDEREPDELVVSLASARRRDGSAPRWPEPYARHRMILATLPKAETPGVSTIDLERTTAKRPGSAIEHHGAWALIDGDSVTFWLPAVVGVHAALVHRALRVGAEPSLRI